MDLTRKEFLRLSVGTAALLATNGITDLFAADTSAHGPIITRKVGKTGEVLPVVGLGTAQTFGDVIEGPGYEQRKGVIKALTDNGGTLIDTAPTYSNAEAVTGKAMRELGTRDKIYISTKISITGEQAGIDQFNKSLKDLGTDHVELLHIHNLRDFDTHLKTVRRLKAEGKTKAIGATHFQDRSYDDMVKVMKSANLDWVQINYAIDDRGAEKEILPLAKDLGMGVMLNLPFGRDRLFDKVKGKDVPDWAVKEFDADTWGKFFLKYLVSNDAVTCAIPGTTFAEHVVDNMGAARGRLPDEAMRKRMVAYIESL
jgi:aryl-alcohol dehydrogenase-like predicted oxidoreductase